jgi:hypothetical protein
VLKKAGEGETHEDVDEDCDESLRYVVSEFKTELIEGGGVGHEIADGDYDDDQEEDLLDGEHARRRALVGCWDGCGRKQEW